MTSSKALGFYLQRPKDLQDFSSRIRTSLPYYLDTARAVDIGDKPVMSGGSFFFAGDFNPVRSRRQAICYPQVHNLPI